MEKRIFIVFGLPGSGKSYFAQKFAERFHAEYLSSDRLRKLIFPIRTYSDREKEQVYDELLRRTKEIRKQNKMVLVDASFYKKELRESFLRKLAPDPVACIEIIADESLIRERLKQKRADSEADFEVYKKIKAAWEPMPQDHLVLQSTNSNLEPMLQKAAAYLHLTNDQGTNKQPD